MHTKVMAQSRKSRCTH